jgi:hypothetical protein
MALCFVFVVDDDEIELNCCFEIFFWMKFNRESTDLKV